MNERLESKLRHSVPDFAYVPDGIFARKNNALDSQAVHDGGTRCIVNSHLSGAVDLEARINFLDQADDPDVLYNRRVDASIDCLAKK